MQVLCGESLWSLLASFLLFKIVCSNLRIDWNGRVVYRRSYEYAD